MRCAVRLLLLVGTLAATSSYWLPLIGQWLSLPGQLHTVDAIIVLGGNNERTRYGTELYRQKLAPELWHTGFAASERRIRAALENGGVPSESIHWLPSVSTWTDSQQIAALAQQRQIHSMLVITDWWHSRRALCAVRQQMQGSGVTIYFTAVSDPELRPDTWWQLDRGRRAVSSELIKFVYYGIGHGMLLYRC